MLKGEREKEAAPDQTQLIRQAALRELIFMSSFKTIAQL